MKKVFTLLSLIFVSLCSMTIFIGCSKGKDKDKPNNNQPDYNIQINADMFQTQYKIGQPFRMVSNSGGKSIYLDENGNTQQVINDYNSYNNWKKLLISSNSNSDNNTHNSSALFSTDNSSQDVGIPIGTYVEDGKTKILYDTDDYKIIGFTSKKSGTYVLKIKFGKYVGEISYTIDNDNINEINFAGNNHYYVNENVDHIRLRVIYESGYTEYINYSFNNNENIDTSSATDGDGREIILEKYNNYKLKYYVHNIKSISQNGLATEFPIGFTYDFANMGDMSVVIETTDNYILNKYIHFNALLNCESVGEHTLDLVDDTNTIILPYNYTVYDVKSVSLIDDYQQYSISDIPKYVRVGIIMSNGLEFNWLELKLPSTYDYDADTNLYTYHIHYQNFDLDYHIYVIKEKSIKSISVDGLWTSTYFQGENFSYLDTETNNLYGYADKGDLKNSVNISYLDLLDNFNPDDFYSKIKFNNDTDNDNLIRLYDKKYAQIDNIHKNTYNEFTSISKYSYLTIEGLSSLNWSGFNNIILSAPIYVTYDDNTVEVVRADYDSIIGIENFDSKRIGNNILTLQYNGILFNYKYKVEKVDEVSIVDNIFCGEYTKDKGVTAKITFKNGIQKQSRINDYVILETPNRIICKFGYGLNSKIKIFNKQLINGDVEIIENNQYTQYKSVNSLKARIVNNGITDVVDFQYKLPTSECGDFEINLSIGGKIVKYNYKVVGIKKVYVDSQSLNLYKDFPNITRLPLIIEYTDGSYGTDSYYLFNPIILDTVGNFTIKFIYSGYNYVDNITFDYEVKDNPVYAIEQNNKYDYIVYGQKSKEIEIIVSTSLGTKSDKVTVNFEDYLTSGVHSQQVVLYGTTFTVNYIVEQPIEIEFSGTRVYQLNQVFRYSSLNVKSNNTYYHVSLDSEMIHVQPTNTNIAITGFDTSTAGIKELTIHYYNIYYKFKYIVGEIESVRVSNSGQRFYINESKKAILNIKFKGIEQEVASYEYYIGYSENRDIIGDHTYELYYNDKKLVFNYTVYDYLSCEITEIRDTEFEVNDNTIKITSNNIGYLPDDSSQYLHLKYKINTTDGQTEELEDFINIKDNRIGVHKQELILQNKFKYIIEYEIKQPKNITISLSDGFTIDDTVYYVKGMHTTARIVVKIIQNDGSSDWKYYYVNLNELNVGTYNNSIEILGQNLQYSFEVVQLDNIDCVATNDVYLGYGNILNIKIDITSQQGVSFVRYISKEMQPTQLGENKCCFYYYDNLCNVKYNVISNNITSIEIVDNTISTQYHINSDEKVLNDGATLKVNYEDGSSEIIKYYVTYGGYFYIEEKIGNSLIQRTIIDGLEIYWQDNNKVGEYNFYIYYKGYRQLISYSVID